MQPQEKLTTMSSILSLGLLLALVTPGYCMTCYECYSINASSCTGPAKECGSRICMSGVISISDYNLFGRSCAPNEYSCGVSGSMTSKAGKMLLSTSCCNSSNCTPEPLDLPTTNPLINGVICPSCTPIPGDTCKLECRGKEKNCAYVELTTVGPSVGTRLQGCATDSICYFPNQTFDIENVVYHLGIKCSSPPSPHLQQCFLYLILLLSASLIKTI